MNQITHRLLLARSSSSSNSCKLAPEAHRIDMTVEIFENIYFFYSFAAITASSATPPPSLWGLNAALSNVRVRHRRLSPEVHKILCKNGSGCGSVIGSHRYSLIGVTLIIIIVAGGH